MVYKGYDFDNGREIAWNVINVGKMSEEEVQRIKEEVDLIKKLKHQSIINYIAGWINENKNEVVFITDIYSGGSLKQ
jgi:serine/threonine protein kinase